ncbi:MAG: hypothetical protein V4542_02155 [Pseudomonadota bacterium]
MHTIPDDAITDTIQYFGANHLHQIQQELTEGLRNGEPGGYMALRKLLGRLQQISQLEAKHGELAAGWNVVKDLQDTEFAPMLSPERYTRLLGIDADTLALNAQVSTSAITQTPGAPKIQAHLKRNLLVIKAAYDAAGENLPKALHWFRTERLLPFGQKTAEEAVAAGQAYEVICLIDSLNGGAAD